MAALGDRRFRRLLVGNSLSSFGDSALYLTLGIWAKDLTGSNAAAGAIFLAQGLAALSAPLAGQLADRVPRRPLLIVTNAVTALVVLALLGVHSAAQLWIMYAVAFAYGASFGVLAAGRAGLVKDLVSDADLASANAAFVTASQGLRLISPLVGAALYAGLGGGAVAILDAVTFVAAIAVATIHVPETAVHHKSDDPLHTQLLAGATHLRRTPLLRQIVAVAVAAMLVMGFYESLTFAVIAALHRRPSFFGVLMSVQAAGSILGGLFTARMIRRMGESRTLGVALVAWTVASLVYTVPTIVAAIAALFVFGVAVPLHAVSVATAMQRCTPAWLQGRVNATTGMATNLAQTTSIAVGALLVDRVGYRALLFTITAVLTVSRLMLRPVDLDVSRQAALDFRAGLGGFHTHPAQKSALRLHAWSYKRGARQIGSKGGDRDEDSPLRPPRTIWRQ
jgi:MFS family permease